MWVPLFMSPSLNTSVLTVMLIQRLQYLEALTQNKHADHIEPTYSACTDSMTNT